eukprot:Nk52_evm45s152 gene=Nk52_evmTU45s152
MWKSEVLKLAMRLQRGRSCNVGIRPGNVTVNVLGLRFFRSSGGGIAVSDGSEDLYKILDVERNADQKHIKKRYLELCKKHHPDSTGKADADHFHKIQKAFSVLSSPLERQKYDVEKRAGSGYSGAGGGSYSYGSAGFGPGRNPDVKDHGEFDWHRHQEENEFKYEYGKKGNTNKHVPPASDLTVAYMGAAFTALFMAYVQVSRMKNSHDEVVEQLDKVNHECFDALQDARNSAIALGNQRKLDMLKERHELRQNAKSGNVAP